MSGREGKWSSQIGDLDPCVGVQGTLASGTEQLDRITYGSGVSAVHWCAGFGRDVFAVQCFFLNMCLWTWCVRSSLIEDFGSGVSTVHCLGDFLEAMCSQFS